MQAALKRIAATLVIALSGCATLGNPATFATCSAADTATTIYGASKGFLIEKNPLLAGSVNSHAFIPFVLSKLAVVGLVYWVWTQMKDNEVVEGTIATASLVTCGIAANNAAIILKVIK